jgi:DNA segregation ATPase FtsK/SpoIIIE, S-DNA-T family
VSERKEHHDDEPQHGGEVIPLRAADAGSAVAFEEKTAGPSYIDTTEIEGTRREVIPEHLTRAHLPETLGGWLGKARFQLLYHGIRSPWHVIRLTGMAHRGAGRLIARLLGWANWAEGWVLESQAVAAGRPGHHEAMRAHTEGKKTRGQRWRITGVCSGVALAALLGIWHFAGWWGMGPLAAIAVPVLIWHGRPFGKPIIEPAILPPAYTVPTPEIITRGFASINIPAINKVIDSGAGLEFISDVHRDHDGWGVELNLPFGVTAKQILARRDLLSSGLRRPLSAVWPEPDPGEHDGRL